jgi:hypothetical protein
VFVNGKKFLFLIVGFVVLMFINLIRNRNFLPFTNHGVTPCYLVGFVFLMFRKCNQKQKLLTIHEPRGYSLLFGWLRVPHVYKSNQKQKLLTIHEPRGYSLLFGWLRVPHVYKSNQKQTRLTIHEHRGYSLLFGWLRVPHVYKSNQKQKLSNPGVREW